jgi:hypothetical protein
MQKFFQNSFFDSLFNSTIEPPRAVKKTNSTGSISSFSLFGMKKNDSVRDISTPSLIKTESKDSKEKPYYPYSGMSLFFA